MCGPNGKIVARWLLLLRDGGCTKVETELHVTPSDATPVPFPARDVIGFEAV